VSNRLQDITRRKQALIEKAALDRLEVATAYRRIRSPLDFGKLLSIGKFLRAYPVLTAGLSTFLLGGLSKKIFKSVGFIFKLGRLALPLLRFKRKPPRRSFWRFFR
jgi:hypothetical protein